MSYFDFGELELDYKEINKIIDSYDNGYVLTRKTGQMKRVRSLRINLKDFLESSENRRILRKFDHALEIKTIPYENYSWKIHKLGKDFYESKFGKDTFSANKIKELFTTENNFNSILTYRNIETNDIDGYCIVYDSTSNANSSQKILHYAYPFYKLELINTSFGLYMMTKTIQYVKSQNYKYIYLGSVHEKSALYKLQFSGLEWFDEKKEEWSSDLAELKLRVS